MTPSEAIKEALRLSGVSAAELTRRLGLMGRTHVDAWIHGRTEPRPSSFFRVLQVLDLDGGITADGWSVWRRPD